MIGHLKEVAWAFFLILLFLGCMLGVFGGEIGYKTTFWVCLGFTAIVAAIFSMLLLTELLWLSIIKMFRSFFSNK